MKRQVAYGRFLVGFGLFANTSIYFAFFTGIYDFRATEMVNMRRVPFLLKFAVSSLVSMQMCRLLWAKQIYEPDLYRIAIKYRPYYDKTLEETE